MSSALEMDSLASFNEILVDNAVIDSIHHELDSMTEKNVILYHLLKEILLLMF